MGWLKTRLAVIRHKMNSCFVPETLYSKKLSMSSDSSDRYMNIHLSRNSGFIFSSVKKCNIIQFKKTLLHKCI